MTQDIGVGLIGFALAGSALHAPYIRTDTGIGGEGANPVPPAQALAVMEVLDAGLRSAQERREIALSPDAPVR